MTNALNALRLRWRARQETLLAKIKQPGSTPEWSARVGEEAALKQCIQELLDTVAGVRPLPLNEASTEKLYRWAPRMIAIMDLMIEAQKPGDEPESAVIAGKLGDLAEREFLNDLYDLFKQLANRGTK